MKNSQIVTIILGILLLSGLIYAWSDKNVPVVDDSKPQPKEQASIVGCYVAKIDKDVYTLNIKSQVGENFSGDLSFKNFQKDSSSGSFNGTYKDGILLGDYSFQSEGTFSVAQNVFKKTASGFVRGYGEMNATGDRFRDTNNITYDSSSPLFVFDKTDCPL